MKNFDQIVDQLPRIRPIEDIRGKDINSESTRKEVLLWYYSNSKSYDDLYVAIESKELYELSGFSFLNKSLANSQIGKETKPLDLRNKPPSKLTSMFNEVCLHYLNNKIKLEKKLGRTEASEWSKIRDEFIDWFTKRNINPKDINNFFKARTDGLPIIEKQVSEKESLIEEYSEKPLDIKPEKISDPDDVDLLKKFKRYGLVANSQAMLRVFKDIEKYKDEITVLITGETGTGKELVAKAIHKLSKREGKPFVVVDCAIIPDKLVSSELFGYEKGAFTDAKEQRIGKFEQANSGTLFLDEIGNMKHNVQESILRVTQEKKITRLSGNKEIEVDVRLISATNKNLEEEIQTGSFRDDLYYRINKARIHIPPLRERKEDIPLICNYFLKKYLERYTEEEPLKSPFEVLPNIFSSLMNEAWLGNVRELESHIDKVANMIHRDINNLSPRILKKIIDDPDQDIETFLKPSSKSIGSLIRENSDWNVLSTYINKGFNCSSTTREINQNSDQNIDRATVQKKINSTYLRLGNHLDFNEKKMAKYLKDELVLDTIPIEKLIKNILGRYKAIIRYSKKPTLKKVYYADNEKLVKKLIEKRPDLI